jgi:hypothetical protein
MTSSRPTVNSGTQPDTPSAPGTTPPAPAPLRPASVRIRLRLLRGVARRFFLNVFCGSYVRRSLARRQGTCKRCGVCCHLVANKCASLEIRSAEHSSCRLYTLYRLPNCCTFPIDPRDLADRDLVAPDTPCGYTWPPVPPPPSRTP